MVSTKTDFKSNSRPRCAYCHEDAHESLICNHCNVTIHPLCLTELKNCPTLGCNSTDFRSRQQDSEQHFLANIEFDRSKLEIVKNFVVDQQHTAHITYPADRRVIAALLDKHRETVEKLNNSQVFVWWRRIKREDMDPDSIFDSANTFFN